MARFIKLTALRRNGETLLLNLDTIEYMLPLPGVNGTALISTTHHTKYEVQESLDDILAKLDDLGMVISIKEEAPSNTEVTTNTQWVSTIIFDKNAVGWTKDSELNEAFIEVQIAYIIDGFLNRGYVYLKDIYEKFGIAWDPHNSDVCWNIDSDSIRITYDSIGDNIFAIYIETLA